MTLEEIRDGLIARCLAWKSQDEIDPQTILAITEVHHYISGGSIPALRKLFGDTRWFMWDSDAYRQYEELNEEANKLAAELSAPREKTLAEWGRKYVGRNPLHG